jgi:acetate kinase
MKILCVNAGSSSLKFQVYEMPEEKVLINGYVEKIGEPDCYWTVKVNNEKIKKERPLKDHTEAAEILLEELLENKVVESLDEIKGVGHRVLHGGEKYKDSCLITAKVVHDIEDLTKLGPLHHPGNLAGIKAMEKELPDVPMVAVFDTAFHATMPKQNYLYPVPYEWYKKYGVRKYGFHGTSHKYITETMKKKLNKENPNLIICHIGSGSSISCIKEGKCYDTTMGITPLDGLMMGTRSGSIDPSILEYVCKESGQSIEQVTNALNKQSGFLGVCGKADCRDVEELMEQGDETAKLAYEMYTDRVAKYIAEYYLKLDGKLDGIVFTAGVGENGPLFREIVLRKLNCIGIIEDKYQNNRIARYLEETEGKISSSDSKVDVYVVPTNEEIMIVRDVYNLINK